MDLVQRVNENENAFWEDPEKIPYFAGKSFENIIKKVTPGGRLFAVGSRGLAARGILAIYRVVAVTKEACDVDDPKLVAFTNCAKKRRTSTQYRIKVEPILTFDEDNRDLLLKSATDLRTRIFRVGLGTLPREMGDRIMKLLEDV